VARAEAASGSLHQSEIASRNLHGRMGFTAQLPHGFDNLRHPATIGGMIVAEAAAIRVERKLADTGDQVAVRDKRPTFALFAKP